MTKWFLVQRFSELTGWQTVWDWETAGFYILLSEAAGKLKQLSQAQYGQFRIKMCVRQ